jgi:hypothetical protein
MLISEKLHVFGYFFEDTNYCVFVFFGNAYNDRIEGLIELQMLCACGWDGSTIRRFSPSINHRLMEL